MSKNFEEEMKRFKKQFGQGMEIHRNYQILTNQRLF